MIPWRGYSNTFKGGGIENGEALEFDIVVEGVVVVVIIVSREFVKHALADEAVKRAAADGIKFVRGEVVERAARLALYALADEAVKRAAADGIIIVRGEVVARSAVGGILV
uniref:Uncharacterized protein n=1 Tax=Panagrolaimus sp. ES5 TaxID=591445 RepID=A0AC34FKP9_9BILA